MAEVTDVGITNGIPTTGTGTVPTLSKTNTVIGAVDESAPGTDTASSGLNGRLQRIAQRLTTMLTGIVLAAGTAIIGKVSIDQTTPGTTDSVTVATGQGAGAAIGATTGAAVITDANGTIQQYLRGLVKRWVDALGAGTAAAALRITIASDAPGIANATAGEYETVAASQTTQSLGATGAAGDYLEAVLIVPASTSPGNVLIRDGVGSDITIFTGGASSITDLAPIYVPLGIISLNGAWKVTTGSAVSAVGIGNFT